MDKLRVRNMQFPFKNPFPAKRFPTDFPPGNLGEVLIRCNNVLYIHGIDEEDEEGEMKD